MSIRRLSDPLKRVLPAMPEPANLTDSTSAPSAPISSIPTTEISVERLRELSKNAFLDVKSRCPSIEWAGVFGSVSRGTQRADSDIDLIIGHATGADYFADVGGSMSELQEIMPEALGREVDIVHVVKGKPLGYVQMEALLSCHTVLGDLEWPVESREEAERLLREGYARIIRATALFKEMVLELPSKQVSIIAALSIHDPTEFSERIQEFLSPDTQVLRQAILSKLLAVIKLVRFNNDHPLSGTSAQLLSWLFSREGVVRECLQLDSVDGHADQLADIWTAVSDRINGISLKAIVEMAEQSFRRGGMQIPTPSDAAIPG